MFDWLSIPEKKGFACGLPWNYRSGRPEIVLFSPVKEVTDGVVMGTFIGGFMGVLQGFLHDVKGKELCKLSSSWALNGAAIGAVVASLNSLLFSILLRFDKTPTYYIR